MHAAIRRIGLRLRVYAPVGELVPGMAYLVRRLLENTSNESFVRHRFAEGRDLDELLAPPAVDVAARARRRAAAAADRRARPRRRTSPSRRRSGGARRCARRSRRRVAGRHRRRAGPRGAGGDRRAAGHDDGDDRVGRPGRSRPCESHRSASCGARRRTRPSTWPLRAWPAWRRTPAEDACGGAVPRRRSGCGPAAHELAALEVFEAGKPWEEADADVCEAIDFCEYYGREMLRLAGGGAVQSPPGEAQRAALPGAGRRRRHRAVELPARHPDRDGRPRRWSPATP